MQTDELNCELVQMPDARYRMEYPPIETAKNATKVFISLVILEMGSFKELENTYTAKIAIELRKDQNIDKIMPCFLYEDFLSFRWFDKRLTFANLKKHKDEKNTISRKQVIRNNP
jgi:hypothetical protein